jgi:hypothetical protein
MSDTNLYEVLGMTDSSASPEEITAAYRRLARVAHPDAGGNDYLFHRVHEAYEVLGDPTRRATYHRERSHQKTSDTDTETADVADADVTVDDGWTRVDDTPYGAPRNAAATRASLRDRVFAWDWRHRHYNGTPRVRLRVREVIAAFFAERPWLFVLVPSLALSHAAPKPATVLFVLAVLARVGSRRVARRRVARRVKPGQFDARPPGPIATLSLFGTQVISGVVVLSLFCCGPLRHHVQRRGYRDKYRYRYWV